MTISPPESGEKNKKVLEDPVKADPRPIDFAKLDKPGFWSSKLSKGPNTTTWIWNLHADAHDFDVHTGDAAACNAHSSGPLMCLWLSCAVGPVSSWRRRLMCCVGPSLQFEPAPMVLEHFKWRQ